jgi:hypothetical protein
MSAAGLSGRPDGAGGREASNSAEKADARTEARPRRKEQKMRKLFEIGGLVAAVVLIAFGIAALVLGAQGGSTVQSNLKQEYIFGSPDMSPTGIAPGIKEINVAQQKIAAEQAKARVPEDERYTFTTVSAPSCSVADEQVTSGDDARCFAQYMRIHALESSSGLTYAQMGRFQAKPDAPLKFTDFAGGTSDEKYAVVNPATKQPVPNGARNTWVTETALTSALNLAFTASRISLFGIVVGVALLLTGIRFAVLAIGGALRNPETALTFLRKRDAKVGGTPAAPKA